MTATSGVTVWRAARVALVFLCVGCTSPTIAPEARAEPRQPDEDAAPALACTREQKDVYSVYVEIERRAQECFTKHAEARGLTHLASTLAVEITAAGAVSGSVFAELSDADPLRMCGQRSFEGVAASPASTGDCEISFPVRLVSLDRLRTEGQRSGSPKAQPAAPTWIAAGLEQGAADLNGEAVFVAVGTSKGRDVSTAANRAAEMHALVMKVAAENAGLSGFAPLGDEGKWRVGGPTRWVRVTEEIAVTGVTTLDSWYDAETDTTHALVVWPAADIARSMQRLSGSEAQHRGALEEVDRFHALWLEKRHVELSGWGPVGAPDERADDGAPVWLTREDASTPELLAVKGEAAGIDHAPLRRTIAANRAKAALAKVLCRRIQFAEFSGAEDPQSDGAVQTGTMTVTVAGYEGITIADGWSDPTRSAHHALALLSGENLRKAKEQWWEGCTMVLPGAPN